LARHARIVRIEKYGHVSDGGRNLLEQFEPFTGHREFEIGESGGVAAGARQARNQPAADRVRDGGEHERDRAGVLLHDPRCFGAVRQDDVRVEAHQVRCSGVGGGVVSARQPLFEVQIAIFTPAEPRKSTAQGGEIPLRHRVAFRQPHEHADPPHALALLRVRRERPHGRAAEQRDELSAIAHSITSSASASS